MSALFGDGAARLAGAAAMLLGWRPGEFWTATPAELASALGLENAGAEPADRTTMAALLARFPDEGAQ